MRILRTSLTGRPVEVHDAHDRHWEVESLIKDRWIVIHDQLTSLEEALECVETLSLYRHEGWDTERLRIVEVSKRVVSPVPTRASLVSVPQPDTTRPT